MSTRNHFDVIIISTGAGGGETASRAGERSSTSATEASVS